MPFIRYEKRELQSKIGLMTILLLLISGPLILNSVQPAEDANVSFHNLERQSIQSDSASLSVPYVDEHYGYTNGIIDPKEYAVNFTDPDTGITAYFEHNSTTLFVGLSGEITGLIGLGWKNYTDDFVTTGLNGSDLIYGYAPGSPHSSYSRAAWSDAVTVNFSLYLRNGSLIAQGTFPGDEDTTPLSEQPLLEGYKEAIIGMRIGEVRHFIIPAEDAYNVQSHPLYGEDLEYVIVLTRINSNYDNPTDSSQIEYSDRHGNDTLQSVQDSDQSRIIAANASDDGTVTQVEYFIQMNSEDVNDIPLLESTELEFPFVFLNSIEDFDDNPTIHTDWASPLLLKFLPNTVPSMVVENPQVSDLVEDTISIVVNITDNTFVRTAYYRVDDGAWTAIRYNFLTGLWNTSLDTADYDLGEHTLWVNASDPSNAIVSLHFNVTFVDYTAPEIDTPPDINLVSPMGYYFYITWHPFDARPFWQHVLLNGSEIVSGSWSGEEIQVNITSLEPGVYNYTLVVVDTIGHQVSDSVIVTITESTDTTSSDTTPTSTDDTTPPFEDVMYLSIAITGISVAMIIYVGILYRRSKSQK